MNSQGQTNTQQGGNPSSRLSNNTPLASRHGGELPPATSIVGSSNNSTTARQRQEGAVQAFKIANEAASYLNGNLTDVQQQ